MYRISDKALRFWLVVCIVLTVVGLALSLYFGLSSAGGSLGDAAYNLNVIRENIVDFENYQDLTGENRGFRKSSGYIVLRRGTDGIWKLIYQSDKDLNKDRWTPEDLSGFDTIAMVMGFERSQAYQHGNNGPVFDAAGEILSMLFYDPTEREIIMRDSITNIFPSTSASRPEKVTWANDAVVDQVKARIAESYTPLQTTGLTYGGTASAGLCAIFLAVFIPFRKKRDKKRKQNL